MSRYSEKHKTPPPCAVPYCDNDGTVLRLLKAPGLVWLCEDCVKELDGN
jgi:hypothetical protein